MLAKTFHLDVNKRELGAIIVDFLQSLMSEEEKAKAAAADDPQPPPTDDPIPCGTYLRYFFQIGYKARDKERKRQKRKQRVIEKREKEEEEGRLKQIEYRLNTNIDYDFSELDEARAEAKLKEAAVKYDRNALGAKSLDAFDCEHLSAGAFREMLRRTFDLVFSSREMGYLVRKLDTESDGKIHCAPFITSFLRMGIDERYRLHKAQLDAQAKAAADAAAENASKLLAAFNKKSFKVNYDFEDSDLESVLNKLTEVSLHYDKSRGMSLDSFEPESLSPQEFHAALLRTFNLNLNPSELGAIICTLDKDGTGKVIHIQFFPCVF